MRSSDIYGAHRSAVRFGAMGLPTFHGMGILLQLCFPLCTAQDVVVFAPQYPAPPVIPHHRNIYEACSSSGCDALIALPSYVEVRACPRA